MYCGPLLLPATLDPPPPEGFFSTLSADEEVLEEAVKGLLLLQAAVRRFICKEQRIVSQYETVSNDNNRVTVEGGCYYSKRVKRAFFKTYIFALSFVVQHQSVPALAPLCRERLHRSKIQKVKMKYQSLEINKTTPHLELFETK